MASSHLIWIYSSCHSAFDIWPFLQSGPNCLKLTMALVNASLKLWSLNMAYMLICLLKKMWVVFVLPNATYIFFFQKNNCELVIVLTRTVQILITNEFVKLTRLCEPNVLCISVLRVASGPRVKLASCKSALNPTVVCSTDCSKAVVPVLVLLFVALWFILRGVCLSVCHFVLVFFSPFSIAITSLREVRANLSAFRTFVRFVLV